MCSVVLAKTILNPSRKIVHVLVIDVDGGDWLVQQLTSWNPLFGKIKTIQEWKGKTLMTAENKFGQNGWLSTITRGLQKAQIEAEFCVSVWIFFCYSVSTACAF